MGKRTFEDVKKYVEWQSQGKCNVLSAKPEQHFNDLGVEVCVWNVKTDTDGDWWVVEGDSVPMNLYPQSAYYFGTDEVYSFHMGLMQRMSAAQDEYHPEDFVNGVTLGAEIAPQLFRKLKSVATLIDVAKEIEDFQALPKQMSWILLLSIKSLLILYYLLQECWMVCFTKALLQQKLMQTQYFIKGCFKKLELLTRCILLMPIISRH